MQRIKLNMKRLAFVAAVSFIFYLLFRLKHYHYSSSVTLPKVAPVEVWEFVADFSNMKLLNPTMVDFNIVSEQGNYEHWQYSVEYSEHLSHWPYLRNEATAHFDVVASPKTKTYLIHSSHTTCLFRGYFCLLSKSDFKFSYTPTNDATIYEERIKYQCPAVLSTFCARELEFQRDAIGSEKPAKEEGKLRLYSMEFCPYAQRPRMILLAKNILHDIVNVNLTNKPEWLLEINSEAKVPVLDTGSKIVVESLDICDFLDEEYPNPPLYPAEPTEKAEDKALIARIGPITRLFSSLLMGQETKTPEEWVKEFLPLLEPFEAVLEKRNSAFFGGAVPGMVDYMLWPWAERAPASAIALDERLHFSPEQVPKLRAWRKTMAKEAAVVPTVHKPETHFKMYQHKAAGTDPGYDTIE